MTFTRDDGKREVTPLRKGRGAERTTPTLGKNSIASHYFLAKLWSLAPRKL